MMMNDPGLGFSLEEKLHSGYTGFVRKHGMRPLAILVFALPLTIVRFARYCTRNSKRLFAMAFSALVLFVSLSFTDAAGIEVQDETQMSGDSSFLMELEESSFSDETAGTESSTVEREFSADDWRLILVNKQHPIPEGYEVPLGRLYGWQQCDERIADSVTSMVNDASGEGLKLIIASPYRERARQEKLFNRKIQAYMSRGMSYMDSYKKASQAVTVPGASEHEIGLAVDIISGSYRSLNAGFGETPEGKWLADNSWRYGFILRYPEGKENITSIEYEPWHFRYVGEEAAQLIYEEKLTLEEFWDKYL